MKAYTDIEQSKKLAEILPLESADMHYSKDFDGSWFVDLTGYTSIKIPRYVVNIEEHLLPCWSLAALLEVLPDTIIGKDNIGCIVMVETMGSGLTTEALNLVDACVKMILKLKEKDLT